MKNYTILVITPKDNIGVYASSELAKGRDIIPYFDTVAEAQYECDVISDRNSKDWIYVPIRTEHVTKEVAIKVISERFICSADTD